MINISRLEREFRRECARERARRNRIRAAERLRADLDELREEAMPLT